MTEQATAPVGPHTPVAGPCANPLCEAGDHVCTVCGGGLDAFQHLPEAQTDQPVEDVEAGSEAVTPAPVQVSHSDDATGGERT